MPDEYPKEKLKELYGLLPDDLKKALFSDRTANDIHDVCVENGIREKNPEVAKYIGYVLLGLLSPNELEKALKEKIGIEDNAAKKINQEVIRLVFLPVKDSLEMLHKMKIEVLPKPVGEIFKEETEEDNPVEEVPEAPPIRKKLGQDTYREPVE